MAKAVKGLTARTVQTLRTPGYHADGGGLYLRVTEAGAKMWVYRYVSPVPGDGGKKRRRDMGLGGVAISSLAEAREKAAALRKSVAEGIDPLDQREAETSAATVQATKADTFREVSDRYIAAMAVGWKDGSKSEHQWRASLDAYAHPIIGHLPVDAITTDLVLRVLEPIWATKTETAGRVRGRIESILDAAKARGLRTGENPARWRGHLDAILPAKAKVRAVENHEALPYRDLPAFWPRLQVADGMGARALEFVILTAGRTGEVLGARWEEIDMDAATWTVPAARMKAGKEHRVPLTEPALALLRKMSALGTEGFVFPGQAKGKPLSNMSMVAVLRRMKVTVTPHGFRSTFRTWAAECTSYSEDVAEAALAHTISNKVQAAYQRGDLFEKRRRLMNEWARYVQGVEVNGHLTPAAQA